jgi:hypothetical protein
MHPSERVILILSVISVTAGLACHAVYRNGTPLGAHRPGHVYSAPIQAQSEPDLRGTDGRETHIDLYGNPVDDAVGDYRLGVDSQLYERHSPETAVRVSLAPPGA